MSERRTIADWMAQRGLKREELLLASALDDKVFDAIVEGRYTPSPQQRQRLAAALAVQTGEIVWGHTQEVQHLYGHGPQFGRTP
jgi:ribosome-binding protein aMBF1 (putative translation factor)